MPAPGPYCDAGVKDRSLGDHLGQAPVDDPLFELELRNAVAEQATDALRALEDLDVVARTRELLGDREPRRP